jgi:fatty acid desaturase
LVLVFHLGVLSIAIAFQFWVLLLVLTFQQFTANALKYFVGFPMHCGLRSNVPDFRKCVRSITLDPVSEFLYWHMNWHLEHHMYAGVPCYNLKKLHRLLAGDMPQPRTLVGAWREMRDTWRRQKTNPDYEYDTPVPTPAARHTAGDDALARSFGDLSPPVLEA